MTAIAYTILDDQTAVVDSPEGPWQVTWDPDEDCWAVAEPVDGQGFLADSIWEAADGVADFYGASEVVEA